MMYVYAVSGMCYDVVSNACTHSCARWVCIWYMYMYRKGIYVFIYIYACVWLFVCALSTGACIYGCTNAYGYMVLCVRI